LTMSPMPTSIIQRLEGVTVVERSGRVARKQIRWSSRIPVSNSLIASKNEFRSAKTT
jgi:hypothetical protein